jgi:uroporphyrinogen-III synthase
MRIAVTTTADSVDRLVEPLVAAGFVPVILPCIRIEPVAAEVLHRLRVAAETADWIFVTSARALRLTWPDGTMPPVRVAAVGEATAAAATSLGGRVELVGDGGAANLARRLAPHIAGASVVYPAARGADPATASILEDAGAAVVTRAAYLTVPIAPDDDPVDGVVFGSPSAVAGWRLSRPLTDLVVVAAMGPTTAAALAGEGRPADIVPDPPRLDLIVAALAAAAERTPA